MFTNSTPYFSVTHSFEVFLETWPEGHPLPTEAQLHNLLPTGMQLMSDVKALEADCLLQLRHLDDESQTIVDYLKLQSRKIDLVLQHVLAQTPHSGKAVKGMRFGGSEIQVLSDAPLPLNGQYKVTLFIKDELISIMCFAQVTQSNEVNDIVIMEDENKIDTNIFTTNSTSTSKQAKTYLSELTFNLIQDSDIEQLVKASLNVQQKQLKRRKFQP
ncbi:hypothetical protein [uncultured Shewanella sp.]|uniref:hypothetical protein n=1 Tax=uncultured Shewanella sp. TaxID=173975 RepID=UPI00261E44F1|nr:hypothetical protein [uncultured Shewanella sp.]